MTKENCVQYKSTQDLLLALALVSMGVLFIQCHHSHAHKEKNGWDLIGPGGGGSTFIPTFSYHTLDQIMIKCDMTGNYLTNDGGESFEIKNFVGDAQSFAFDPLDSNIIYVGGLYLFRSSDKGISWHPVYPTPEAVLSAAYTGDHAELSISMKDTTMDECYREAITCIKIDPLNSSTIYFSRGQYFFYSFDQGTTWEYQKVGEKIESFYTNDESLKEQVYLFAASRQLIFNKSSKKIIDQPLPAEMTPAYSFTAGLTKNKHQTIIYALHHQENKPNVYEVLHSEVWRSTDLGCTWQKLSDNVLTNKQGGISPSFRKSACAEFDADHAYVVCNQYEEASDTASHPEIWYGALKTSDGGVTWQWAWKGGGGSGQYGVKDATDAPNLEDAWVHKAFGGEFIQLIDVGVAPYNGEIAIVTDWYRSMKTIDGGGTWQALYSKADSENAYISTGLDVTTNYGVHFDPFDSNHLAISYTDIGYHHSYDGGKSWTRSVTGIPTGWVNTCYWVAFDPEVQGKVWSAWSGLHDLPRGKMMRNTNWKNGPYAVGGVGLSLDGGRTWTPQSKGMGLDAPTTSIVIDPSSPRENRTLYAAVYTKGVFKSTDDGHTWTLRNHGFGANTCASELTISPQGDLYVVISPVPQHRGKMPGADFYPGAVYRSSDGAASWTEMKVREGLIFPSGIAADPQDNNKLYLACWSEISLADLVSRKVAMDHGGNKQLHTPGGIYLSQDKGDTWTSIFDPHQYVYDVTVDPFHQGRLYCNTFNQAAYRSDDYGHTWNKIKGYDFHWGHRIIVDENNHEKVYITTYGSSVWHGMPITE